ncbi:hypothetical protein PV08_09823 [Exophiala spinifera]|uniref:Uncharacterized protein n=1 Tax=Exophiala spinifera TaxID=91928 RepID=A0A0D1YCD1_9EURO|nr:uncharacterized protein PV08_09823 [Exophiala spinifera]KIW12546.1 hypothetical protein PV08_09823 [Exophiala spinifera]
MNSFRMAAKAGRARYASAFPWAKEPFIVGAPMRVISGPELALAVSKAGGLGFVGPGLKPESTARDLATVQQLLKEESGNSLPVSFGGRNGLPVGVGFQVWNGDINSATRAVQQYRPCAAWLFAPRRGTPELEEWTARLRIASPATQVWVQIGTVQESIELAKSPHPPDVLVVQGAEAGGHGRATDGLGIMTLFPEVADQVLDSDMTLFAAGGIADGRGVAAALALGATGVALGTRFLASTEARISKGYQQEVVRARDGAHSTVRTHLYNHLRGTMNWPEQYSPRTIINKSWREHQAGIPFEVLEQRYNEALDQGDKGWGPDGRLATYAGAAVGLVQSIAPAGNLVTSLQAETRACLRDLRDL